MSWGCWRRISTVVSQDWGLRAEGCRLVQNWAYEMAWVQHRSAGGGNKDKEHTFDTPPFSMYQCTAMRLALPMRLLKVTEQMMIICG